MTRARHHIKVFASFLPERIEKSRVTAQGSLDLRSYLEYAQLGPIALTKEITSEGREPDSPFEEAVAKELSRRGLHVVTQVGVGGYRIDMAIRDTGSSRFLLGVECDGATYHSSRTARDRDRLRQSVLENLGWTIHRIWSTDWLKHPEREIEKVLASLERARRRERERAIATNSSSASPNTVLPHPPDTETLRADPPDSSPAIPSGPMMYEYADLHPNRYYEQFTDIPIGELVDLIEQYVAVESPVHVELVMKAVTETYGFLRVGHRIRARIQDAVQSAAANGKVTIRDEFLWLTGSTSLKVRGADAHGRLRAIEHVSPEEISVAMNQVLTRSFAMTRDDLASVTARELGYERTGSNVSFTIHAVLDKLVAGGILQDIGGQVSRTSKNPAHRSSTRGTRTGPD